MHLKSYNKTNGYKSTCLLGAHFSVAGGLHHAIHEAHAHGCNALQIFTKNASTWKERELSLPEIERFDQARKDTGITAIASHAPYLINLATNEKGKYAMSRRALTNELLRSSMLDIPYVVLHPGAHMGVGEKPGSTKIISGLKEVFARTPDATTRLLLETTAGQGSSIGHTFEQLALIMEKVNCERRLGICLDTSHIFAAGYDIRTKTSYHRTINLFDAVIGIGHLYLIHLNDAKRGLGSRVDRHEHIGKGHIGIEAFRLFMNDERFANVPKIIETPRENQRKDSDMQNLNRLRGLLSDGNDAKTAGGRCNWTT